MVPSDLDDPIGASLRTHHERFAEHRGSARRYRPDISPFCSVGIEPTQESWRSLSGLLGASGGALFMSPGFRLPEGWRTLRRIPLTQMTYEGPVPDRVGGVETRELGRADVPEMLRLTAATEPGPFAESTVELGGYVGVFDGAALVAMAGRRMNPPGFVEVSAVCTDPAYRGRGYARTVMLEVVRGIGREGHGAFLHVADGNPARALYERLGFVARKDFEVLVVENGQQ
jgi:ribosomal protein S18 acetylase RimI-like enzyme